MPTTVHIPKPLLEAVDRKARALRISRNRFVVRAIERELNHASEWSPGFFDRLAAVEEKTADSVDKMLAAVHDARRSKEPMKL